MKVRVFGGTHGNEWTGIIAVTKYADSLKAQYPHLDLNFILSNPEAYKMNRRFKDEDLNRAFQFLHESRPHSYEHNRAREIKALIDESPCFVIDLHTTTSNLGSTLIITRPNSMNYAVAASVLESVPDCKIIYAPDPEKKYLGSQSDFGMMIEVGPIANGVIEATVLEHTLELLEALFESVSRYKNQSGTTLEMYEEIENIHYPVNKEGEIEAFIHPQFQGKDFLVLRGEFTPFKSFSGENIVMKTQQDLYPIFINEAAYYPSQLAFTLCRKIKQTF